MHSWQAAELPSAVCYSTPPFCWKSISQKSTRLLSTRSTTPARDAGNCWGLSWKVVPYDTDPSAVSSGTCRTCMGRHHILPIYYNRALYHLAVARAFAPCRNAPCLLAEHTWAPSNDSTRLKVPLLAKPSCQASLKAFMHLVPMRRVSLKDTHQGTKDCGKNSVMGH